MLYKSESAFLSIYIYEDEEYPNSVVFQKNPKTGDPVNTLIPKEAIIQVAEKLTRQIAQRRLREIKGKMKPPNYS